MPQRGPEAGVYPILAIFMITVRTLQIYVCFLRAKNAIIFKKQVLRPHCCKRKRQ